MTRRAAQAVAAAALGALAITASPALAGSTGQVEVDADLVSATTGARIAAVTGSLNGKGRGFASIVPLSGASSVGMNRGEAAQLRRQPDGSILVVGGLGTQVRIAADERARKSAGAGRLSLALNARRTLPVVVRGVAWSRPFTPARGQRVLVIGTATGAIRTALGKRYRLVRYEPSQYSRSALLANPARYRSVAGVLVGQNVSRSQMAGLDVLRTFFNSGRWVSTPGNPGALDQHMYVVAHAHLGRAGVIMRRATPPMGQTANRTVQIREPRIAHVRVGASRTQPNTVPPAYMKAGVARASTHLATSLAQSEPLATSSRAREAGALGSSSAPPVPNTTGQAVMQVLVNQQINVVVTNPSYLQQIADSLNGQTNAPNSISCTPSLPPGGQQAPPSGTFNFITAYSNGVQSTCPPTTSNGVGVSTQMVSLTYNNTYTVTLHPTGTPGGVEQVVNETTALDATTVPDPSSSTPMAAGSVVGGIVQPTTYGTLYWFNDGGGGPYNFWQTIYNTPQEAAFTLSQANHMVAMSCGGCVGTGGGPATPTYAQEWSSPNAQVLQPTTTVSTGTNWDTSSSSTSGWSVGGNLGFFGTFPMGGATGGYNSSTSSSVTQGGTFNTSSTLTYANWVTNPSGSDNWAQYQTQSQNLGSLNIPALSPAYPANFALPVTGPVTPNGGDAFVPLPAQYGPNNPGPTCPNSIWTSPMICTSGIVGSWGSQMNAQNYYGGTVSSFTLDVSGNNQLAVGSVTPNVADTLYLWDQFQAQGFCECTQQGSWAGLGGSAQIPANNGYYVGLQVLDLDSVQAAQQAPPPNPYAQQPQPQAPGTPTNTTATTTGSGIAGSITTYYGANGQVLSGVSKGNKQIAYTTLGLDLCAPPVLTSNLWAAGCSKAPGLKGRPATVAGAGPTVTGASGALPINAKGQYTSGAGTALTCKPGSWSGSPTFTYQWSLWNPAVRAWGPITGATSTTYTPTTAGQVVLCGVTATNSYGSAQSFPASVVVN